MFKQFKEDIKFVIDNWNHKDRRPIYQIILLFPVYLIYLPAKAFVDWLDGK